MSGDKMVMADPTKDWQPTMDGKAMVHRSAEASVWTEDGWLCFEKRNGPVTTIYKVPIPIVESVMLRGESRVPVTIFEGEHGEEGYSKHCDISISEGSCTVCKEERLCLETDGSNGEYFNGRICRECANKAWAGV